MRLFGGRRIFLAALLAALLGASFILSARDTSAISPVPANDDFPGTVINSLPYSQTLDTAAASSQPDEPTPQSCGFFGIGGESPLQNTVWWSLTPAEFATYEVDTVSDGTWAPEFVVWRASQFPGGGLTDLLCRGGFAYGGISDTAAHGNFQAECGQTYYIEVAGDLYFGNGITGGSMTLSVRQAVAPANDNIADATVINSIPFSGDSDLTGATTETSEPSAFCANQQGSSLETTVWFTFTATESQDLVVNVSSVGGFPLGVIWSGVPGDLHAVQCGNLAKLSVEAGDTYYFQVGEESFLGGQLGGGVSTLTLTEFVPPECPDLNQTTTDATGDATNPYESFGAEVEAADVTALDSGSNTQDVCFRLHFAEDFPTGSDLGPGVYAEIVIDADSNPSTGFPLEPDPQDGCGPPGQGPLGVDEIINTAFGTNLVPLLKIAPDFQISDSFAVVTVGESWIDFAIPLDAIGGNATFDMVAVSYDDSGYLDCIPDGGILHMQGAVVPNFGDINCDGVVGVGDSVTVLRFVSGAAMNTPSGCPHLSSPLPWTYPADLGTSPLLAGDVNCDATVTAVDALHILRSIWGLGPSADGCPLLGESPVY